MIGRILQIAPTYFAVSFAGLVDQLAPDPQTRGRQFELLCRWYLQKRTPRGHCMRPCS